MTFDHIKSPMTLEQIQSEYQSGEYSAELLLQHLLLWVQAHAAAIGEKVK